MRRALAQFAAFVAVGACTLAPPAIVAILTGGWG